jgi:PilZ domain
LTSPRQRTADGAGATPFILRRMRPGSSAHLRHLRLVYTSVAVPAIVLIGPVDALASLREQLTAGGPPQTFTDHQIREAVEYIARYKPAVVAIDEQFAVSPRGESLIGRIMDDPGLSQCEIRILARASRPEHEPSRKKSGTGMAAAAPGGAPAASEAVAVSADLDRRGTRRAERIRILEGVSVTVDGNPAELIDLSPVGAQVISKMILRPNQRVRLQLLEGQPEARRAVRCSGSVVWASFEMPAGKPPRYRAGLKLSGTEIDAVRTFADRYRAPRSDESN